MLLYVLASLTVVTFHTVTACPFHTVKQEQRDYNNFRRSEAGPQTRTAISDVRVYNGLHFAGPETVCFDAGYIVDEHGCANAAVTINGTGKFLISGLIDSHLHLTDIASLESFTSYGLTTAMHMNCGNATQCQIMRHQPGLAQFFSAGRSAVGKNSSHEATDPVRPKDTLIYPGTNVTQFVVTQFDSGADFHKITAEVNGPSIQQQTDMIRVAHATYQKQAMTHASSILGYEEAVDSMTDGIQHVPDDGLLSDAIIALIKYQNQFVTPTLNVFEYAYSPNNTQFRQYFGVTPGSNRTLSNAEENACRLYRAGIPLIAGTDSVGHLAANGLELDVPWGLTLHYELQHLVYIVGMTPAEAINAATSKAAKWHRIPDRGQIKVGMRADLLMLDSDPLIKIENTMDVHRIWALGIEVQHVARLNVSSAARN
jgi:imidazolonepropionase-like amidohydrolase